MSLATDAADRITFCPCRVATKFYLHQLEGRFEREAGALFGVFTCSQCGEEKERVSLPRRNIEMLLWISERPPEERRRFLDTLPSNFPAPWGQLLLDAAARTNAEDLFPTA